MREAYDAWASEYDADLETSGYLTPGRIAEALFEHLPDLGAPIMDYGCGTGLSGAALKAVGYRAIDGADLSQGMLDIADGLAIYRRLSLVEPGQPPASSLSEYRAITAAGVVSKGAALPAVYGQLLDVMQPGALLAFSLNDLSMADPDYRNLVSDSVAAKRVRILSEQHGPHLAKYGKNSGSTVYVLERLG